MVFIFDKILKMSDLRRMLFTATLSIGVGGSIKKVWCKLDTGANVNLMPIALLPQVKYREGRRVARLRSASGHYIWAKEILVERLAIEGLEFNNLEFFVPELESGRDVEKNKAYCLLGMEFVRRVEVSIQPTKPRVVLTQLGIEKTKIPLWSQRELDIMELTLEGAELVLLKKNKNYVGLPQLIGAVNDSYSQGKLTQDQSVLVNSILYDIFEGEKFNT